MSVHATSRILTAASCSADELTYAPQMETCPEHVKAKLPKVFQEEFDFRADHLHGLQKRIDRALEVVNGNL